MSTFAYKHRLLAFLTVVLTFNYVDRMALGIVFEDIKADLLLSDTQLGFLSGLSFALFYAVMGIPIARWADRGNRTTIISLTTALWSGAVALCGLASNYAQLLAIRVLVAVGEAGCTPPAFSLIADFFKRSERARALAIYGLGGPIASIIGFFVAGWINELYGWRVAFMLLGIPGIVLTVLARIIVKEPRLQRVSVTPSAAEIPAPVVTPKMYEIGLTLWRNQTLRHSVLCLSILSFFTYGMFQWQPAFMMRKFGLATGVTGTWFALTYGVGGILGSYLGGELASRYAAANEGLQLKGLAIALAASGVLAASIYFAPTHQIAFLLMGLYILVVMTANGPLFAIIQTLAPERMRAVIFAVVYLLSSLIGMGLGPLAVGMLSDALRPTVGDDSLRYGLLALTPGFLWVAWHSWRASSTVQRDLAAVPTTNEFGAVV